jgi:hypothetical protein
MPVNEIQDLLARSQWVIRGRIAKVGVGATPDVPESANLAVVNVQEILHGPPQFDDHLGRDITLYSEDVQGLRAGRTEVFFTQSWFYGQGLGVVEVGRLDAKASGSIKEEIATAEQSIDDQRLGARLSRAQLVVLGIVAETGPGPRPERDVQTEHHPEWWVAELKVERVIKGKAPDVLRILFASSTDEMWLESPKAERGQEAVWILQQDQQEKGWPVLRVPGLTALDPLDVQPVDQLERVIRLVEEGKQG